MAYEDIQAQLREIIRKNMPAQVGLELEKLLAQGRADAAELEASSRKVSELSDAVRKGAAELSDARAQLMLHDALTKREAAIVEKENRAKIVELEIMLKAEQRISAHATDIAVKLVRNTEYRASVFDNRTAILPGSGGGSSWTQQVNDSKTENRTAE